MLGGCCVGIAGADVAAEAAVLRYVAGCGFPVPRVYRAEGADLVMDRVDGPTMASTLLAGMLGLPDAARQLADLHHRLHELPPRLSTDPAVRVLHMDLYPHNVLLSSAGPVVIDWSNPREGAGSGRGVVGGDSRAGGRRRDVCMGGAGHGVASGVS
jgi:RIO-like serine/threonine protein kinase